VIDGNGNTPKWLGGAKVHPERTRPMAIFLVQSTDVMIQDLTVKDAAMWAVVNMEVDNLTIRGLHVHTPLSGTRDGIDIVDCHHVLIENCDVYSEDDSFCLKSGTARGVEDVVIRNSHVLQSSVANGLKLGTASTGAFRDVTFENILVENVDKAAMAVESVDGADISNIVFRNIQFRKAGTAAFVLLGKRGNPPRVGTIDGVTFENVTGSQFKHTWGSAISGTIINGVTYAPKNILFKNVNLTGLAGLNRSPAEPPEYDGRYPDPNLWGDLPAAAYYLRHIEDVRFESCTTEKVASDPRPTLVKRDANATQD
jgi:polygalacturonase